MVTMFRILFLPTSEAIGWFGVSVLPVACRGVALAFKGREITSHRFTIGPLMLVVLYRVRRDGPTEIETGPGGPLLPKSTFTTVQPRTAENAAPATAVPSWRD